MLVTEIPAIPTRWIRTKANPMGSPAKPIGALTSAEPKWVSSVFTFGGPMKVRVRARPGWPELALTEFQPGDRHQQRRLFPLLETLLRLLSVRFGRYRCTHRSAQ